MTVLIGHGYIGNAIADELKSQGISFRHDHHDDWKCWPSELIINAAGYLGTPNVDACEINRKETIKGNITWPLSLRNNFVLHISTGCIYEGDNHGIGWKETDKPNFEKSFYSLTKVIAEEELMKTIGFSNYILRVRQPFGTKEHSRNLLTKLKSYPKLMNVVNSMSCVEDIARVVAWFVKNRPKGGIYNLTNPGSISVKEISDMLQLEKSWFTPEEFSLVCPAPRSNCVLNVDKITRLFPLRNIHEAMEQCIKDYR